MKPLHITVVIPSFNNEKYVTKNLTSILGQSYPHVQILYLDDASTDSTPILAKSMLKTSQGEVISRPKRVYGMENLYFVIKQLPEEEVVVVVDGDDWLCHSEVLSMIARCYEDKAPLLTFGRYVKYPLFTEGPFLSQYRGLEIRKHAWFLSHLKTFRAGLFQKIIKDDLMVNGAFVKSAIDVAMMWPMYEMAGDRVHQMEEVLYVYNFENANSVATSRPGEQQEVAKRLSQIPPYKPIDL